MKSNLAKKLVQQHIQMLIKSIEGKLRYSITCKILTVVYSYSCTSKYVKYLSCFFLLLIHEQIITKFSHLASFCITHFNVAFM